MTNTHDGSHTWLKYLSSLKKQAEKDIEEFIDNNDNYHHEKEKENDQ